MKSKAKRNRATPAAAAAAAATTTTKEQQGNNHNSNHKKTIYILQRAKNVEPRSSRCST